MNKIIWIVLAIGMLSCGSEADTSNSEEVEDVVATEDDESIEVMLQDELLAKDLTAEEFKAKIADDGIQLIDVRTPEEVAEGAIEGSVNIDFNADDFESRVEAELNKDEPVMVYCAAGGRSAKAMELLNGKGFTEVYNLLGGYSEWPYKEGE